MDENICKFVPVHQGAEVRILNFVYERDPERIERHRVASSGSLLLAAGGAGTLHTGAGHFPLAAGTLAVTFPMCEYYIEQCGGLEYYYVTFVGQRLLSAAERVGLTEDAPVRAGLEALIPVWRTALAESVPGNLDLVAEAVALYSLAKVRPEAENTLPDPQRETGDAAARVRAYADAHYCDAELSLSALARQMSYNPKYLSDAFSRAAGMGFREYVRSLRIQRACGLMQSGVVSSKEIAALVGYRDPLYFSKVFTREMGASPQKLVAALKRQQEKKD